MRGVNQKHQVALIRNPVRGRTGVFKIEGFDGKRFLLLSSPPPPIFLALALFSRGRKRSSLLARSKRLLRRLDMRTHVKPTETFQYAFFTTCHPPGAKKGFVKGEGLRLLRIKSSIKTFEENITTFKKHLKKKKAYGERLPTKLY